MDVNAKEFVPESFKIEQKMFDDLEREWWINNKDMFEDNYTKFKPELSTILEEH